MTAHSATAIRPDYTPHARDQPVLVYDPALSTAAEARADPIGSALRARHSIESAIVVALESQAVLTLKVVLLTASLDDARLLEAFRLGASGLGLKESAPRLLVQRVRQVANGEQSWNGKAIDGALRLVLQREQAVAAASAVLTARELDVTRMVASGLRNKEIASRLEITEGTVKFHLHSIYEKLEINGRYALMSYARDHGLA